MLGSVPEVSLVAKEAAKEQELAPADPTKREIGATLEEGGADEAPRPRETRITCSRGFSSWLLSQQCSLVFTSYQTGQLFLIGVTPDRRLSFYQRHFTRAMGVSATPQRI